MGLSEMMVIILTLVILFGGAAALGVVIRMLGGQPRNQSSRLRELHELHKRGLISEQEFAQKRAEILDKL